jgi:hypothetical protein
MKTDTLANGNHARCVALYALAFSLATAALPALALDRDGNGVDDAMEDVILQTFAPIYRTDEVGGREIPPVPVDWYVRHCMITRWTGSYSGVSGPAEELFPRIAESSTLTLDYFNTVLAASGEVGNNTANQPYPGFWRLRFKDSSCHWGCDRTWALAQQQQDVLYGRVHRFGFGANQYVVHYYLFFPWNDVDADRFLGCPAGNHEGDISCVEYLVEFNSAGDHRILQGIYHDHGRQVFAEPGALQMIAGRPVVFPENETHENMPWPYYCGIVQGSTPSGIATIKLLESHDIPVFGVPIAGECDAAPAVRVHNGSTFTLQVSTVKNLHEKSAPADMHSAESLFVARYAGLYGYFAEDSCDIATFPVIIDDFTAPDGPTFQDKMWSRIYRRAEVWVALGSPAVEQTGEAAKPVSSIARALAVATPGASVHVNAGSTSERLTLSLPMTITAEGGTVTIGQ